LGRQRHFFGSSPECQQQPSLEPKHARCTRVSAPISHFASAEERLRISKKRRRRHSNARRDDYVCTSLFCDGFRRTSKSTHATERRVCFCFVCFCFSLREGVRDQENATQLSEPYDEPGPWPRWDCSGYFR